MAFGCASFGLILGVGFLVLAALITWLSLKVLAMLALDYKDSKPSFYSVSSDLMPKARWVIDAALVINCFGGCICYVQTFGKLMTEGMLAIFNWDTSVWSKSNMALVIQLGILAFLTPLCMMKEITATKIPNMVGLACIFYIVTMTFFYTPCTAMSVDLLKPGNVVASFAAFPAFIFAYACQQNVFSVANEIKDVNMKKLNSVSVCSTLTGFIIYLPIMLLPYMTFGPLIKSNYLYNFVEEYKTVGLPVPIIIAFIFASLSVSISYVLLMQPVRCSTMSLIYGDHQPTGKKERMIRMGLALVLIAVSFALAYVAGDAVDLPVSIAGLLGGNTMCFVMPFLLYLKKYGFDRKNKFTLLVMATLIFCILLYPICLSGIIYKEVTRVPVTTTPTP